MPEPPPGKVPSCARHRVQPCSQAWSREPDHKWSCFSLASTSTLVQPEGRGYARTLPRPDFELLDLHGVVLSSSQLQIKDGWPPRRRASRTRKGTAWAGRELACVVQTGCWQAPAGEIGQIPTRVNHMMASTLLRSRLNSSDRPHLSLPRQPSLLTLY